MLTKQSTGQLARTSRMPRAITVWLSSLLMLFSISWFAITGRDRPGNEHISPALHADSKDDSVRKLNSTVGGEKVVRQVESLERNEPVNPNDNCEESFDRNEWLEHVRSGREDSDNNTRVFQVGDHTLIPRFPSAHAMSSRDVSGNGKTIQLVQYTSTHNPYWNSPVPQYSGGGYGFPVHGYSGYDLAEPARNPFYQEYRVRVGDQLVFVYQISRDEIGRSYRLAVGDVISIDSDSHEELRRQNIPVLIDGTISVSPLQSIHVAGLTFGELKQHLENQFSAAGLREPRITILPVTVNLPNQDLRDAVDGRQGQGGQRIATTVTWDGNIWLPKINAVPVVGLSLHEIAAEVNARYAATVEGIEVTPTLEQPAASFVYVLGEVEQQGRIDIRRPATVLQAITQAGGHTPGANLRDVVVVRRTADWQLIATRLDLHDAGFGRGMPCEDIFVHDGDIIIIPRSKIERLAELVDLYFTRTIYGVMPNQGFTFAFQGDSTVF